MQYLWDLTTVYVKDIGDNQDVVCGFDGKMCCLDDAGRVGRFPVFVPVDTTNLSNFVEFKELTREQVFAWADSVFTADEIAEFKAEALKRCSVSGCEIKYAPFGCKFAKV
jgi:hypothetical protein